MKPKIKKMMKQMQLLEIKGKDDSRLRIIPIRTENADEFIFSFFDGKSYPTAVQLNFQSFYIVRKYLNDTLKFLEGKIKV